MTNRAPPLSLQTTVAWCRSRSASNSATLVATAYRDSPAPSNTPLELEANRERIGNKKAGLAVKSQFRGGSTETAPPSNRTRIERELRVRRELAARNRSSERVSEPRCSPFE